VKKIIVGILGSLFLTVMIVSLVPNSTFAEAEPAKCVGLRKAHDISPPASRGHLLISEEAVTAGCIPAHRH